DEHTSALLACLEMARNGTTCFMEAGSALEPDTVAAAAERIGIRALVADTLLWDIASWPGATGIKRAPVDRHRVLRLLGVQLRRNQQKDCLVRGHVALYGVGTASDELTLAAKECADRNGVTLNQHQSYARSDTDFDDARFDKHPLVHYAE